MRQSDFSNLTICLIVMQFIMLLTAASIEARQASLAKPNILILMTDQQFGDLMSCVIGDKFLKTPHMDALARSGTRFTRAYSPNPLCSPMRASMMTGRYPHQTGIMANVKGKKPRDFPALGTLFKQAGYKTAYFGRGSKANNGFEIYERKAALDPQPAAKFLKQEHDRPFLVFASFLSPHEICEWARKEKRLPGGNLENVPPLAERPPLRENHGPPANETEIMAYMRKSYHATSTFPVGIYTEDDWRRHIWGYYRFIERADRFVGVVMEALRASGQEENTLVVFLSDHGDCHGAHGWNQKTVFYDESSRVPLIISQKGVTRERTSDVLVNVGIDLLPTLLDFAGVKPQDDLPGKSLKKPALGLGQATDWSRKYIVSQNHMVQGIGLGSGTIEEKKVNRLTPYGRMVRSDRYKYCVYIDDNQRAERLDPETLTGHRRDLERLRILLRTVPQESLIDMKHDPGEMKNLARDPRYQEVLEQHRRYLEAFCQAHGDAFLSPRTQLAKVR